MSEAERIRLKTQVEITIIAMVAILIIVICNLPKLYQREKAELAKLHICVQHPESHKLYILHSDATRNLIGTMPLALDKPLILQPNDRLVTGDCQ